MKCEKCGNNEATFHYQSIINGEKEEYHLCTDCAKAEGFGDMVDFRHHAMAMFDSFMRQPVGSLIQNFWNEPFGMLSDTLFGTNFWPSLETPKTAQKSEAAAKPEPAKEIPSDAGAEFRRKRELFEMKRQLREAVHKEEFEKAAELRDKIHALEKK